MRKKKTSRWETGRPTADASRPASAPPRGCLTAGSPRCERTALSAGRRVRMTPRVTGPRASPAAGGFSRRAMGSDGFQAVDVGDVAKLILTIAERQWREVFNAVAPGEPATFRDYLEACIQVVGCRPEIRWLSAKEMERFGVTRAQMPQWARLRRCRDSHKSVPRKPASGAGRRSRSSRPWPRTGCIFEKIFRPTTISRRPKPGSRPDGSRRFSPRWGERGYDVIERPIAPNGNKISDGWRSAACFGLKVGFHDNEKPRLPAVRCIAGLGLSLCGPNSSPTTPSPTNK